MTPGTLELLVLSPAGVSRTETNAKAGMPRQVHKRSRKAQRGGAALRGVGVSSRGRSDSCTQRLLGVSPETRCKSADIANSLRVRAQYAVEFGRPRTPNCPGGDKQNPGVGDASHMRRESPDRAGTSATLAEHLASVAQSRP